jgi:hypothetical protein
VAIVREFERACHARGQAPLVLLLPTGRDLQHFRRHGWWIHAPLVEALGPGARVLDAAAAFACEVPPEPYETLYVTPSRHLNAAGNARLADLVAGRIRQIVPPAPARPPPEPR